MKNTSGFERYFQEQEELEKDLESRIESGDLPVANIIVAGMTGSGKSTLINAVFGTKVADTGVGEAVTDQIAEYGNDEMHIHIWDTVGLEIDSEKTKGSINNIKDIIASKSSSKDLYDRIHALWYCINSGSSRYQGAELKFIKELHSSGVPFIIVLTQCSGDEDTINTFEAEIRKINASMGMKDIQIVQVLAMPVKYTGLQMTIPEFGLKELVEVTLKSLPNFIKSSFVAAQKINKSVKRTECEKIIYMYVRAAQNGFWDKVPLINVSVTDKKILKMFRQLGEMYNTIIPNDGIERLVQNGKVNFKNNFFGLISPVDMGYNKKITKLLSEKKETGFSVEVADVEKNERAARMIAFYGYTFMDAIEELWKNSTEELLKDVDEVVKELTKILNEKLEQRALMEE